MLILRLDFAVSAGCRGHLQAEHNSDSRRSGEHMKKTMMTIALVAALGGMVLAQQGDVPKGIPQLDHVFLIVMENHGYKEIINNPNARFINHYAKAANLATNYFAVAHPSLTNYLELVGGSNFGVLSDNSPDWHDHACKPDIVKPYSQNRDDAGSGAICPIAGSGMDAPTVAVDTTNEVTPPYVQSLVNIDGASLPSAPTVGKTIADQLAERGRS